MEEEIDELRIFQEANHAPHWFISICNHMRPSTIYNSFTNSFATRAILENFENSRAINP